MIIEMTGVTNSIAFQKLEDESKRTVLKELKVRGASHRQLERLTGVGRGLIQKLGGHGSSEFKRMLNGCFLGGCFARNLWRKSLTKMMSEV